MRANMNGSCAVSVGAHEVSHRLGLRVLLRSLTGSCYSSVSIERDYPLSQQDYEFCVFIV